MNAPDDRRVPKVHPLTRDALPDDPLELRAEPAAGDPQRMLDSLLQEFAWIGWDADQLLDLFYHPGYPLLCQLRAHFGDHELRRRVDRLVRHAGVPRFRETIVEADEVELPLVDLDLGPYSGK